MRKCTHVSPVSRHSLQPAPEGTTSLIASLCMQTVFISSLYHVYATLYYMAFHELHSRSLAKTVTYRILIIISNTAIVYALTRQIEATISITAISTIVSTIIYFFHERAWNHVYWGKKHVRIIAQITTKKSKNTL